jgi:hypothetical protein
MTTTAGPGAPPAPPAQPAPPALPIPTQRLHRPLVAVAIALAAFTLVAIGGALFDDRDLLGHPIWMKPLKFTISFSLYCVTLAWMLSLQTKRRPRCRRSRCLPSASFCWPAGTGRFVRRVRGPPWC